MTKFVKSTYNKLPKAIRKVVQVVMHALGALWQESLGEQFGYAKEISEEVRSVIKHKFLATLLRLVLWLYIVAMFVCSKLPFRIPVLSAILEDVSTNLNFVLRLVRDWANSKRLQQQKKRRRNKRRRKDRRRPIR